MRREGKAEKTRGVAGCEAVGGEEAEGVAEERQRRRAEHGVYGEERERVEVELRREEMDLTAKLHAGATGAGGDGWKGGDRWEACAADHSHGGYGLGLCGEGGRRHYGSGV